VSSPLTGSIKNTARLPATSVTGVTVGSLVDDAVVKQLVASAQAATPPPGCLSCDHAAQAIQVGIKRIA